jgi:hypothetical protein
MGVATLTTNLMITAQSPEERVGGYLSGGAGACYFYQHPTAEGAVRPDVTLGAGITFHASRRSMLFAEARYHRLLYGPASTSWILPLTIGVQF